MMTQHRLLVCLLAGATVIGIAAIPSAYAGAPSDEVVEMRRQTEQLKRIANALDKVEDELEAIRRELKR